MEEFLKRIGKKISIVALFVVPFYLDGVAQSSDTVIIAVDRIHAIEFFYKKLDLTPNGKEQINILGKYISENPMEGTRKLVLVALIDKKEYVKDQFIGYKRCKILIDHFENKFDIPLERIVIKPQRIVPSMLKPSVRYSFSDLN